MKVSINSIAVNNTRVENVSNRDFTVINAMFIRSDTAMNDIFYPDSEVRPTFNQLENIPAPLGHPKRDGENVSIKDNFAKGKFEIGAFLQNVKMVGKEVKGEIWIDNETALLSERGKRLMNRIEEKKPIGVSTGLTIASIVEQPGEDDLGTRFNNVGRGFKFDHVALLIDETPAGLKAGTEVKFNSEEGGSLFVVNHDAGGQSKSKKEENSMKIELDVSALAKADRVKLGSMTANELINAVNAEAPEVTIEQATEVVQANGFMVNSKKEGVFISNEDNSILINHKEKLESDLKEIRERICANSKMEAEMLANMDLESLTALEKSLPTKNDYSINSSVSTKGGQKASIELPEGAR